MLKLRVKGQYLIVTIILITAALFVSNYTYFMLNDEQTEDLVSELTINNNDRFDSNMLLQVKQMSNYLSTALFDSLYNFNPKQASYVLAPLLELENVNRIIVFDSEGKIFHDGTSLLLTLGELYNNEHLLNTVLKEHNRYEQRNADNYIYSEPIISYNQVIGGVVLEYSLIPLNEEEKTLLSTINNIKENNRQSLIQKAIYSGIIILFFAIVIVIFVTGKITKPIIQLTKFTELLGAGDYKSAKKINFQYREDEVSDLARSFQDMSGRLEKQNDKISFLAYYDVLTNLPNRTNFFEFIDNTIKEQPESEFTILFVDIDGFKSINDNFGHAVGDQLLIKVGGLLTDIIADFYVQQQIEATQREKMIARIGGDEFLIYLPNEFNKACVIAICEMLTSLLREPIKVNALELVNGISIGGAFYPEEGNSADYLIKHADMAMYHAKDAGKNTFYFYTQQMNEISARRSLLEKEMRIALAESGHFQLYYQPLLDTKTGKLIGAEALIRWFHPRLGVISPDEFIPISEMTGMIIELGEWIIEQLFSQLKQWQCYLSDDFHIALNISAKQIYKNNIVDVLKGKLAEFSLPPSFVHVELTETTIMKDEEDARLVINELQNLGLKVWLDDFGTGYSSLSFLRKFDLCGIKIDKSFVSDVIDNNKDAKLVEALITLAKTLDMPVIAEGVETKAQWDFLKALDCEYVQGYHFSKPLPAKEFESKFIDMDVNEYKAASAWA